MRENIEKSAGYVTPTSEVIFLRIEENCLSNVSVQETSSHEGYDVDGDVVLW